MIYFNDLNDLKQLEKVLLEKRLKLNEENLIKNEPVREEGSPKKKLKT